MIAKLWKQPAFHLLFIALLTGAVFLRTHVVPQDDNGYYVSFIEGLARGNIDLSIPGFQGASFLTVPLYWLFPSPVTHMGFQIMCGFLLPFAAYLVAKIYLKNALAAVLFAYVLALMPFFTFMGFQGSTFPSFNLLLLLTLYLRGKGSAWAFVPWAFSVLTKPFSIVLLPFFLWWKPEGQKHSLARGWVQVLLMLILPVLYVGIQYVQAGHIIVGAHPEITHGNVFVWWRIPLNAAHGLQMLFSVHNFYFPDPAKTAMGNLVHSSPLLMLFGVISLLYPKQYWGSVSLARTVLLSATGAYVLAAMLDHMDHYYMETAVVLLAFASVPFLLKHRLLIPLALATLHFQFFYLYLQWSPPFFSDYSLALIPLGIDLMALLSCAILVFPNMHTGILQYVRTHWSD